MTEALIAVESLTDPRQRFQCRPLSAILAAGTCVQRQRAGSFPVCRGCALGTMVSNQVGHLVDAKSDDAPVAKGRGQAPPRVGRPKKHVSIAVTTPRAPVGSLLAAACDEVVHPPAAETTRRNESVDESDVRAPKVVHTRTEETMAKCSRDDCGDPSFSPPTRNGRPDLDHLCKRHRLKVIQRESAQRLSAAASPKQAAASKPPPVVVAPPRVREISADSATLVAQVARTLKVVERLGGVERAEQFADWLEGR